VTVGVCQTASSMLSRELTVRSFSTYSVFGLSYPLPVGIS
jgi:hypothetical protein